MLYGLGSSFMANPPNKHLCILTASFPAEVSVCESVALAKSWFARSITVLDNAERGHCGRGRAAHTFSVLSGQTSKKMASSAAINEPFLLSSYNLRQRIPKRQDSKRPPEKALAKVHVSYDSSSKSSDGYVTVAAQGDGVHVLDVWSLLILFCFL